MTIPLQFASLYDGQEIFMWSNCLLDLGTDFVVGNMVFVCNKSYSRIAPPESNCLLVSGEQTRGNYQDNQTHVASLPPRTHAGQTCIGSYSWLESTKVDGHCGLKVADNASHSTVCQHYVRRVATLRDRIGGSSCRQHGLQDPLSQDP